MMSGKHAIVLSYSTSHAMRAENFLHKAGIETKLILVPRHLSSNCGVCVRIALSDRDRAQEVLERLGPKIEGIYVGGRVE
ncbi:MAG: DUF3343 domain-containing protein [Anaerolineae bacterium]|nr:DUF3343 domain-containing protein [Anaerolineae bacterium]